MEYTNTKEERRGNKMAFDANEYTKQYRKLNYDQLNIKVKKGKKQELTMLAEKYGKGLGQFVRDALLVYIEALGEDKIDLL